MLRKYGFITIDNGGNGVAYLRVDLIEAVMNAQIEWRDHLRDQA